MKNRTLLIAASITSMLLLFSSCKTEGPTEPASNPTAAAEKINQANQILIPKIVALVNTGDTTALNVSAAASLYAEALGLDPSNKDAHFGLALTDIISLGANSELRGLFGPTVINIGPGILGSIAVPNFSSYGTLMKGRMFGAFNGPMSAALGKVTSPQADHPPSYYQNLVETSVLPKLSSAIAHLTVVLENSSYAFIITPQMTNGSTTETYRIDATEINLMKALLQLVTTEASLGVAYNIDYTPTDSASVYQAWQTGSPFLTLRTNGSLRMKDVRTNLIGAASSIQASLNFLMTEPPNPQTDLINYNPADQQVFLSVISTLDSVKSALSGPMSFSGGPTVNFKNFFDDAIPNYKQMVPAYTVSVQRNFYSRYDAILTWTAASFNTWIFPDPTMRGLFPGMTDANLKTQLGLSALNWEPTVIIPGY